MNTIVKMDTRGRVVIPSEFRAPLGLKEGDEVLLSLDKRTDTLEIIPVAGEQNNLVRMEFRFADDPGSLARAADKLAELKIDLIRSESKSSKRGHKARWDVYADISSTGLDIDRLKQKIMSSGMVESVEIMKVARKGLDQ